MTAAANQDDEQRPEELEDTDDSTDFFRAIGKQLKLLRERAGLTQNQTGVLLGYSEDLISSLERGRRVVQKEFLTSADVKLDAGGMLTVIQDDVEQAKAKAKVRRHPAFFRGYVRLEPLAVELHEYSNHHIPGLLQTEEHARALYAMRKPLLAEQTIEDRVMARIARQDLLDRWPAPELSWIIEEAVLRRPIGGRAVHAGQLAKLLAVGRKRNIELQVMPLDRPEHSGMGGPFVLLTPKGKPRLGYIEIQNLSHLITDPEEVRILAAQYGSLRAQALTPPESLALIEKMLGEL
ncbi:helix-turn-helix domain-containing protein [Kitasatospora sp. NBC_01266]|uniref:helix-turn-helix domain-containing protein n=1 Tax=Kitasatospora sp. NBC_01266 TaxID=2903572 RepID=UPI002E366196|nr:helix-turn-helix transcriptional regulator [Kitasatospora sp. NBC_01266]